ncbi:hypothetical protein JX265_006606 [Neoarthrinium moseri]|uniref:Uncharacterized protein n=1 Tax=Neoarthrinium moseri TaxID=1658444 RepID=A0A9P9WLA2_9PEZI|nr:hypothetical protein JX265_006606 [Neoarthrinium moseri]
MERTTDTASDGGPGRLLSLPTGQHNWYDVVCRDSALAAGVHARSRGCVLARWTAMPPNHTVDSLDNGAVRPLFRCARWLVMPHSRGPVLDDPASHSLKRTVYLPTDRLAPGPPGARGGEEVRHQRLLAFLGIDCDGALQLFQISESLRYP